MNKFNKTKFITGLKALAISMVVLAHLHYQFSALPDLVYKIVAFAGNYVVIFFVVSAFTVSMSIDRRKSFHLVQYVKRRWIRLAPAYYLMTIIGLFAKAAMNHWVFAADTVKDLFLHITFLNLNLIYEPSQSSYLGFEWMIPMLFWFYLLIPLLLFLARRHFTIFNIWFAVFAYLHFHLDSLIQYKGIMGGYRSMQVWLIIYGYTIFVYVLWKNKDAISSAVNRISSLLPFIVIFWQLQTMSERMYAAIIITLTYYLLFLKTNMVSRIRNATIRFLADNADMILLMILAVKYMLNLYYLKNPQLIMTLWSVSAIVSGFHRPWIVKALLENRVVQFVGLISFGLYLDHNLAITAVGYVVPAQFVVLRVLLIVVIAVSGAHFLHRYIEKPAEAWLQTKLNKKSLRE